ncbi:hypothetical protein C0993_012497 [Termitomyces sp. T159_Od127]|nr:hypothetical protein C0993_012497 [Termitomyces sp. T159_Od127]
MQRPPKPDNTLWLALSAASAILFVLITSVVLWYAGQNGGGDYGQIRLPDNETAKLMSEHVPASLHFSSLSYTLGPKVILDNIFGSVKPGQVMAIMGASGAGKSTLLDMLARKGKRGTTTGTTLVNGREVADAEFKGVMGFVDQEDTLMSTLTVYETVLYSALLRLPREMSFEAKKYRTLETMNELGILGIKDMRIGESGRRSISGGEKRRVSIACELVTSPSILFLDEPTSGLDAFNAFNVVDSLVSLARNYNREEELGLRTVRTPRPSSSSNASPDGATELRTRANSMASSTGRYLKHKTSQLLEAVTSSTSGANKPISAKLAALVDAYALSEVAKGIKTETEELGRQTTLSDNGQADAENGVRVQTGSSVLRDVALEMTLLRGRKRASYATQFRILSGRAFKNLYRDPALLTAHYVSSIVLALICGLFFHHVTNDIAGFQNRLGIFFFTLALFGFSCLSSLGLFANERILFMRERANGYYSSFTYFSSKILFDILPLRLVPPLLFGGIVYPLVGLVPTVPGFWKFMLTLVLFNLTTASVVLLLSIAFASISVASLVGTLVMLFNLLFTGLLINRESVIPAMQWLHTISFFHAAFEALAVNELRYLQLKEVRYGVELDVPAATILSVFGLRAQVKVSDLY